MVRSAVRSRPQASKFARCRHVLVRYGLWTLCVSICYLVARRLAGFRALRGMTLVPQDVDRTFLDELPGFTVRRATAVEFARLPGASELESQAFYEGAAQRGDWCWYVSEGDTIASYGWYATAPVRGVDDTWIRFSSDFVYMHKGFTLPRYRGRKLHALGMAHAAIEAVECGRQGLISFVEAHNEASLRSVNRLGYRIFGTCFKLRLPGRTLTFGTRGCSPFGFGLIVEGDSDPERLPVNAPPVAVVGSVQTALRRRASRRSTARRG